jgi:AraC family transcriptional regulator
MNYQQKLAKVVDFIGQHLDDEDITLERLSDIFCISKFHFHRLFTAFSGLSLQQYIRWLRLKRAARQLLIDKREPIINIAINAGFESHEAFSRIFKKICGLSPSQYRKTPGYCYWDQLPYSLPKHGTKQMNIEIQTKEKRRLAIVEHRGDPQLISDSVNRLISWAQAQPMNIKPSAGDAFAFAYDDPYTTPAAEFRLDLGITIPESLKLDQNVIEKYLPAGRYAVTMHKGSRTQIGETVYSLYREWLPQSNEQLDDLPCIFCYYNFEHEVAETELLTECWLLLK